MPVKINRSAVVVGSTNCMPTEYATLLAKQGWIVKHYSDAIAGDLNSNPFLRMRGITEVVNLTVRMLRFVHPICFLFPRLFYNHLLSELNKSDLIILSGASISLARFVKKRKELDVIALGYGDDLSAFCNKRWPAARLSQRDLLARITFGWVLFLLHVMFVRFQRLGLRSCTHVAYFPPGFDVNVDGILREVTDGGGPRRLSRYSISVQNLPELHASSLAKVKSDLKVMFPVRFSSSSEIFAGKGWRVFIEGVEHYTRLRPEVNAAFFCFNKGEDVNEAKQYARQLNVDEKIRWLDVVPFGDLFSLMNDVDVIVDQLGEQWLGVGMWGALLGKPVISNLSNSFINEKFRDACFLHAENADQFASQLQKCESVEFRVKARRDNSKFACNKLSLESEFDAWGLPSRSPRDNDC